MIPSARTSKLNRPQKALTGRFSGSTRARLLNMRVQTSGFLDRPHVQRRIGMKAVDAYNRIGGFIKVTMQRSMRQSTGRTPHSPPGVPPRYTQQLLRGKNTSKSNSGGPFGVKYHVEFQNRRGSLVNLIVGPTYMDSSPQVKPAGKTIPEILNEGGFAYGTGQYVIHDKLTNTLISPWSRGGAIIRARMLRSNQKSASRNRSQSQQSGSGPNHSPRSNGQPPSTNTSGSGRGQNTTRSNTSRRSSRRRRGKTKRMRNRYKEIWIDAGSRRFPARNFTAEPLAKALTHSSLQRAFNTVSTL